jgi:hypothetical protein
MTKVAFDRVVYQEYVDRFNFRDTLPAHALMFYALNAGAMMEAQPQVLNIDKDIPVYYKNMFKTTAIIYGVDPHDMVKHWDEVDRILLLEGCKIIENTLIRNGGLLIHTIDQYETQAREDEEKQIWREMGKKKFYKKGGLLLPKGTKQ